MDSRYHEFVWLTVKEYCTSCTIGSALIALIHLFVITQNSMFFVSFTLSLLFAMMFVLGNRAAHYIATMIRIEREESESSDTVTI